MHRMKAATLILLGVGVALIGPAATKATAQAMAKAQVASLIARVENGVDDFRNYLERRGENASDAKSTAQASGRRKGQVESVVDDGRKINQVVAKGNYGAEAARLWAALRTGINDLARAYGVQPLAI